MKHSNCLWVACIFFVIISASLFALPQAKGQVDNLALESEEHWETYQVGGTCISGAHNLFVGDIDQDNKAEIITGGSSYSMLPNGTTTSREAPLRIWNFNGQNFTIEYTQNWPGSINCVFASDVDGDGKQELMISGSIWNETGTFLSLKVCNFNGSILSLKASVEGVSISDISAKDLDQDGINEILTVGRTNFTGQYLGAKLSIWRLQENALILKASVQWCTSNLTSASSVLADDLNNDGQIEIITAGYAYPLTNSSGQLRVWQFKENTLTLKASEEWQLKKDVYALTIAGGVQGNTMVNSLKLGDLDKDGAKEIVTGGFAYDGENINAQLRIWNWTSQNLTLETSKEWVTDYLTEIKSLALNDVDSDSHVEIVTSGVLGAKGSFAITAATPERAQLRVWSWDSKALTLENGKDWTIDEGACAWNVATGDADKDGAVEIVTVGCTYFSNLCDPDMRIWSTPNQTSFPVAYSVLAAGAVIIAATAGMLLLTKRRRRQEHST